jgi:hypothetical protein
MLVMLGPHSDLSEVLWMFSHFKDKKKRLTLKQNPHFYKRLPMFPKAYWGEFRMHPIETFQHPSISVLTDNLDDAGRVFLNTAGRQRAFSNVWVLSDTIIFKGLCLLCFFFSLSDTLLDVRGKLEGESIVGEAIQGIPNLWCCEEPPLSLASESPLQTMPLPIWSGPSRTARITSAKGKLLWDWREPIRQMLKSRDFNIRITDEPPSNSGYLAEST